ncbi:methyltransferase domain-containing protein [Thermococcus argininiproducens]|uniref:Methyltransferase domain-containing protein n=1 Tax=Thermococcus argininiproducens TaxID=2866384 RepID=A0A9E7M8Z5_9EURY|nr:class I SAM-dependent methyltransferase [Thermococcus argininiproducens]USG99223.1 methyltransferase domain-containing protein [Thermococcus argininiproducens]
MNEQYIFSHEYPTYFSKLNGLRSKIAKDLPIKPGMKILDLATGYGFFAVEIAKCEGTVRITGIDIAQNDIIKAKDNIKKHGLDNRIRVVQMDATSMTFPDESFDMVVNFLGLEDIHMTRGKEGVRKTFHEVSRILKPEGYFCFVAMPPEEMESDAQKLENEVFSYICSATWLSAKEYEEMLKEAGLKLLTKKAYYTGKKLTPEQAKEEIEFACENVPKIYGIGTPSFDEVWEKFRERIEKHGMGHYSKVVLFIAQKAVKG